MDTSEKPSGFKIGMNMNPLIEEIEKEWSIWKWGTSQGDKRDEGKAETKLDLFTSHRMGSKCKIIQPINIIPKD